MTRRFRDVVHRGRVERIFSERDQLGRVVHVATSRLDDGSEFIEKSTEPYDQPLVRSVGDELRVVVREKLGVDGKVLDENLIGILDTL